MHSNADTPWQKVREAVEAVLVASAIKAKPNITSNTDQRMQYRRVMWYLRWMGTAVKREDIESVRSMRRLIAKEDHIPASDYVRLDHALESLERHVASQVDG